MKTTFPHRSSINSARVVN